MLAWIVSLFRRSAPEPEPEVETAQREQRRRFDTWESTMAEVVRVQDLAQKAHSEMHRPRRRPRHGA